MGIPLFIAAFGAAGTLPAIVATVFVCSLASGFCIALIEIDMSPGMRRAEVARDVLAALARNPLVTMPLLGILYSASGLPLPSPLVKFCTLLGAAAGPCALFALGLFLFGQPLRGNLREIGWLTLLKLVVQPFLTWLIAVPILHMAPPLAAAAILLAGLPTASMIFTIAQRYGIYVDRASAVTLATTAGSVVTLSLLLALLVARG